MGGEKPFSSKSGHDCLQEVVLARTSNKINYSDLAWKL